MLSARCCVWGRCCACERTRTGASVTLAGMPSFAVAISGSRLLWIPLLVCGCGLGLFDDNDNDDGGEGGRDDGGAEDGWVTGGTPTDGNWEGGEGGPGGGAEGGPGGEGGASTTGIEPTGADNELPEGDQCPCVADNEDVYVLSDVGTIWKFDPKDNSFDFITEVSCGGMIDTFSMGVSRKARAWVQYFGGDLYTVDLKDPGSACKDPGFENNNPLFPNFGMAFVADGINSPCDRLYAHSGIDPALIGEDVGALGVIDPITLELSEIAMIDFAWGELTGTGDGRLFAFQGAEPPFISEYDKDTGALLGSWPLPGLSSPDAFAFAAWGGDFYLFMTSSDDYLGNSRVVHFDFDESDGDGKAITTIVDQAPIRIVGAGVSTCAPQ